MPTLKEVLDDKNQYADNLVWQLPSGPVTLGQMRTLRAEEQSAISKREEAITASTKTLEQQNAELKKAQLNTANLYVTLQKAQEAIKKGDYNAPEVKQIFGDNPVPGVNNNNNNNDPFAALERLEGDALLGPLVKVMKAVSDENKKAQAAVAANLKVQENMAMNYLNGTLEDRYDRLIPIDKQDKFPLATLIQNAVNAKQFRTDGTPDIRAAYKSLTSGDDTAAAIAAARADERKKVLEEQASGGRGTSGEIFSPVPQTFGLDVHNRGGKAPQPFKSLDEAFAAAAKDKDIWANVDSTLQ